jgi:hypothetical protein
MKLLFGLSFLLLIGCNNQPKPYTATTEDSLGINNDSDFVALPVKSNLETSPVKIISSRPVTTESGYKDISVTYKNISPKNIAAVRFKWIGLNAFGEPADNGNGTGSDDQTLLPGKTRTNSWSVSSRDLKKIVTVIPIEVVFEDGTKWESN